MNIKLKTYFISFAFITCVSSLKAQFIDNNPVAKYYFSGNVLDSSNNANHGSFTGSVCNVCGGSLVTIPNPTFTSDRFNKPNSAYQLGSEYNFISIPNSKSLQVSEKFSFSFWLNPNLSSYGSFSSTQYVIFAKWGPIGQASYQISLDNTGKPIIYLHNGVQTNSAVGKSIIPFNKWTNVIFSKNLDTVRIFINGKLDTLVTGCYNPLPYNNTLEIGRVYNNIPYYNDNKYYGKIDDINVYDIPIDSVDAVATYNQNGYGTVLPVDIVEFSATFFENKHKLNWKTKNEINVKNFIVERSFDGVNYTSLSDVQTNSTKIYEFIDSFLPNNLSNVYYRLKIVDLDGSITFSKTVNLNRNYNDNQIDIFPNPVKDILVLKHKSPYSENSHFNILNLQGQIITSGIINNSNNYTNKTINVEFLKSGTYILQVITSRDKYQKKFIKL